MSVITKIQNSTPVPPISMFRTKKLVQLNKNIDIGERGREGDILAKKTE